MRTANDAPDSEGLCISTHKLFDIQPRSPTSPILEGPASTTPLNQQHRPTISIKPPMPPPMASTAVLKRSASPSPSVPRKRSVAERISTKDFIPPDVSGLSKREARLGEESRQRKREEFETMEIRVAELEQENARLLALAQGGSDSFSHPKSQSEDELASEVKVLREQLANAQQRELELSQELAMKSAAGEPPVKMEAIEPTFPISSPRSQSPHKAAASLGLMSPLPTTTFSLPSVLPASSSPFDFNSILPRDFDWSRSIMDLDTDRLSSLPQKLEFTSPEVSKTLGALGVDISFDAIPQEDGKIRVRIHPSSSVSSRAASPGATSAVSNADGQDALGLDLWGLSDSDNPTLQAAFSSDHNTYGGASSSFTAYSPSSSNGDPFLGVGGPSHNDFGNLSPFSSGSSYGSGDMDYDLGRPSDYSPSMSGSDTLTGSRRRVRIALKSMPATGGEGGEWEVQFC
ncbi:hypothetical protein BT96DRAFT_930667 [Gymnopus androsaceus JB14]|uniref:BZIP domain-containing protein n=1 Tax=Gymnopus androsaceus JB14 TaxID=1447944 RepID=A0A6A4IVW1_9AGAR|nr:hypothetical protein BT96DRAFT_930667 [Gymnopus androsaceus JB14]